MTPTPLPTPVPTEPTVLPADSPLPPAPVLDASSADWWWQYGLDGFIGALIGGLVTAVAVWLTLRHERQLAATAAEQQASRDTEQRAHEASVRELDAASVAVADLQAVVFRLIRLAPDLAPGDVRDLEEHRALGEATLDQRVAAFAVAGRCRRRWPAFTKFVQDRTKEIGQAAQGGWSAASTEATVTLGAFLASWMSSPDELDEMLDEDPDVWREGAPEQA